MHPRKVKVRDMPAHYMLQAAHKHVTMGLTPNPRVTTPTERQVSTMKKAHGTRYTYISGCRCKDCRKANSTYIAQYRQKRAKLGPETPCRTRRLWRTWEDVLASDYTKSASQIGLMLGRTASDVTNRRHVLLTRRTN